MAANQEEKFFADIILSISAERFHSYKDIYSGSSNRETLARYLWNIELSESLYPVINVYEIALRNNIYSAFQKSLHPQWLHISRQLNFRDDDSKEIDKARDKVRGTVTDSKIISELSLGFWARLFNANYDEMWRPILGNRQLNGFLPNASQRGLTPRMLRGRIERVRRLRNYIAHHESILRFADSNNENSLQVRYNEMIEMIGWLHPAMQEIAEDINRFQEVYSGGPQHYNNLIEKYIQNAA